MKLARVPRNYSSIAERRVILLSVKPCSYFKSMNVLRSHELRIKLNIKINAIVEQSNYKPLVISQCEWMKNRPQFRNKPWVEGKIIKKDRRMSFKG